jgi:hypothetical protein
MTILRFSIIDECSAADTRLFRAESQHRLHPLLRRILRFNIHLESMNKRTRSAVWRQLIPSGTIAFVFSVRRIIAHLCVHILHLMTPPSKQLHPLLPMSTSMLWVSLSWGPLALLLQC